MSKLYATIFLVSGLLSGIVSRSQTVVPVELLVSQSGQHTGDVSLLQYANHKNLPAGYEQEVLTALSYFPELKNVPIKFKVKKSRAALKTRPAFFSMLMPKKHRSYVITISDKTVPKIRPLLFVNLPEDVKIGVMGHELSHVVDFEKNSTWQSCRVTVGHLSAHYLDSLEFNTDRICIRHGMGKYLEAWSSYIRTTMHVTDWRGSAYARKGNKTRHQRYMNPDVIEKYMADNGTVTGSTTENAH